MARNAGSVALSRCGATIALVAAECGVGVSTVGRWFTGEKKPGPDNRQRLFALHKIPLESWNEEPKVKRAPISNEVTIDATAAAVGGPFAMARELELMCLAQLKSLREDKSSTPLERSKMMHSLAPTIRELAKITGDYDLERRLFKLPLWKRIERELRNILTAYPDAARAVAEVFERLDETGQ